MCLFTRQKMLRGKEKIQCFPGLTYIRDKSEDISAAGVLFKYSFKGTVQIILSGVV